MGMWEIPVRKIFADWYTGTKKTVRPKLRPLHHEGGGGREDAGGETDGANLRASPGRADGAQHPLARLGRRDRRARCHGPCATLAFTSGLITQSN